MENHISKFNVMKTCIYILILSVVALVGCGSSGGGGELGGGEWYAPVDQVPTVTFTAPEHDATDVPIGSAVSATFSEVMNETRINETTFTLKRGVTAIPGDVTYTGLTAVFTPDDPLEGETVYTARITTGARSAAGVALESDYVWNFTTGVAPDVLPPTVALTVPANDATAVPLGSKLSAVFSEAMNPATITETSFTLSEGENAIDGDVTYSGLTAVFTPSSVLEESTLYTARITTAAQDLSGNALASNYTWTFTTGVAIDETRPTVSFTSPTNGSTAVALNRKVNVAFSEAMDTLTLTNTTFTLAGPGATAVTGTVAAIGSTATFTPQDDLLPDTEYTATVTTGAEDLAGNSLAANYIWSFTTGAALDVGAPTVSVTSPTNTAIAVPVNRIVTVGFSEAMTPATISTASFLLEETVSGNPINGTVAAVGTSATFSPTSNLTPNTEYTGTITNAVTDLAGNPMLNNFNFTFTTGDAQDALAPSVTFTSPTDGATAVPLNRKVDVAFNEVMDPLTLTTLTFKVTGPGLTPVVGTVTALGSTATFQPLNEFDNDTTYTATVTTGAKDLAGNPLAEDYVWTFSTSLLLDTTAPTVTTTLPLDLAVDVPNNTLVTATFSESMDSLTIVSTNFTLTETVGSVPVPGTVTYAGGSNTAIFTPLNDLDFDTNYTATIYGGIDGVADLAGNVLEVDKVWTFQTGVAPDAAGPTITLQNPADLAIDVPLNSSVNATFSEAMDPLTITTLSFTVEGVTGLVSYDPLSMVATFTPTSNLLPNTTYTATVTSDATDLAGNPLAIGLLPNPWTFTTGTGLAPGAVALGSAGSFGIMATSAITSTGFTVINGDVSLDPGTSMTGFPAGIVNGSIHVNDTVSEQARADLLVAYNFAKALPPGTTISAGADLGALYPLGIPPGTYTSGSTMLVSTPLVLDAGGNANAVWVFQIGSSLTTGASVSLANGAQSKNVFWVPTEDATIGVGTIFYGTIVSGRDVTGVTGAVINGRILAGAINAGTIALDTNTINVPAP